MESDFYVSVGQRTRFTKTVGESDVYLFAGITGDLSPNHVDQVYMERSRFGTRMAHGALLVGFMSTASTMAIAHTRGAPETPVSAGYDRIRFIAPVLLGDTITVTYTIAAIDRERRRSTADMEVANQRGELVAVGRHILQWVPGEEPPAAPAT
ncbi:MAG: MaoC/PaaZ C-terminal domain-containing protein [Spirochaetaceae bacterium]|nr:MaoC/PaaZ C-terminal domain-containing protein [Spirochaetaceae bacterium]